MNDSAVICDEVIDGDDGTKAVSTNFNEKKVNCKTQNFYLLLAVLLITMALFIVVCIYCYLMKYWAKKPLLPFDEIKLKQFYMNNIN